MDLEHTELYVVPVIGVGTYGRSVLARLNEENDFMNFISVWENGKKPEAIDSETKGKEFILGKPDTYDGIVQSILNGLSMRPQHLNTLIIVTDVTPTKSDVTQFIINLTKAAQHKQYHVVGIAFAGAIGGKIAIENQLKDINTYKNTFDNVTFIVLRTIMDSLFANHIDEAKGFTLGNFIDGLEHYASKLVIHQAIAVRDLAMIPVRMQKIAGTKKDDVKYINLPETLETIQTIIKGK